MIRSIQQGERIAEKNAAETRIRRNSSPSRKLQPTIFHAVTHLRIAAENPAQTQIATQFRSRKPSRRMTLPYCKKLIEVALPLKAICPASPGTGMSRRLG